MGTQHTPGPWKAVQIFVENAPSPWAIQRKSIREQWGKPSIATYIDSQADAQLIAAAPELLEQLKLAHRMLLQTNWIHEDGAMNELLAVIRKAEGI